MGRSAEAEAYYAKAVDEILLAKQEDPALTNDQIAEYLGKSEPEIEELLARYAREKFGIGRETVERGLDEQAS